MKSILATSAAAAAAAAATPLQGQLRGPRVPAQAHEHRQPAAESLADFVEGVAQCYDVHGLTMGVVRGDELAFEHYYGVRDDDGDKPVNEDTRFGIGSTTKAFTSAMIASLVEDGVLDWDTPVGEYWPEFGMLDEFADQRATLRDLLAHKTSLPRNDAIWYSNAPVPEGETAADAAAARLKTFPQAMDFRAANRLYYNNWAVAVAGWTAEKVTGTPYAQLLQDRILDPLGMNATTLDLDAVIASGDYAIPVGTTDVEGYYTQLPADINKRLDTVAPAGALNSHPRDMAKWMQYQLTADSDALLETHNPQFILGPTAPLTEPTFPVDFELASYGFGWIQGVYNGRSYVWHNGGTLGHSSYLMLFPEEDVGVFISQTGGDADTSNEVLALRAVDWAMGLDPWLDVESACVFPSTFVSGGAESEEEEESEEEHGGAAARPLADYVGVYERDGWGPMNVSVSADGDFLEAVYYDLTTQAFAADLADVFNVKVTGSLGLLIPGTTVYGMYFLPDAAGDIQTLAAPMLDDDFTPEFTRV